MKPVITFLPLLAPLLALDATQARADEAPLPVLTLSQALSQARSGNWDLKVAQARLAQAHELHSKAWAAYLPNITLGASYTRNSHGAEVALPGGFYVRNIGSPAMNGPAFDPTRPPSSANPPGVPSNDIIVPYNVKDIVMQKEDQLGAQVTLTQPLIVPALWSAIKTSRSAESVAEKNVDNARRDVLFGVAQLYYGAASLRHAIEVHQRLLESHLARERDASSRVAAGAAPRLVLVRAQIDRTKSEQDVRRATNAYSSAKLALATLLGRSEPFEVEDPGAPPPPLSSAERRLPAIQAARAAVDTAQSARRTVLGKYAPALGLQAAYRVANVKGFVDSYTSWAVTLGLSWTLWDGGLRESEAREARAKVVEAQAALRSLELKVGEEEARARLDLESALANLTKANEQVRLARENMQMVTANDKAGMATQLELTDAATALSSAELSLVAERLNADLAALRLQKAQGAFDPQ